MEIFESKMKVGDVVEIVHTESVWDHGNAFEEGTKGVITNVATLGSGIPVAGSWVVQLLGCPIRLWFPERSLKVIG